VGSLRLEGRGALDSRMRRLLTNSPKRQLEERIAELLSTISRGLQGVRVEHLPADDFSQDAWFEISYRAPGFAMQVDNGLEFRSPMLSVLLGDQLLFRAGAQEWGEERESDIFLYYTQSLDIEERIGLPRGFGVALQPERQEIDETYAYFRGDAQLVDDALAIRVKAEVRRRQIPPEGFGGFRAAMEKARDWSKALFRLEPETEHKENKR
jgi:hypothetical protein